MKNLTKIFFLLLLGISIAVLPGCLEAKARIDPTIETRIDPRLDAIAQGQAGLNNKMENISNDIHQELKAGRDVNNSTVQFNQQMLEALKSANAVAVESIKNFAYVLVSLFGGISTVLTTVFYRGKKKAEEEREISRCALRDKQRDLERALGALPPETVERIFPPPPPFI